jgi:hypothetical protein
VVEKQVDEVDIKLSTNVLSVFRHLDTTAWNALGEFVDNSIDSYLKNKDRLVELHGPKYKLHIDIIFESSSDASKSRILINDNAAGINENDAKRAFTPGVPPFDKTGISRFGIGMKASALWYSSNFNITSSALGESVKRTVFFDVDRIISENLEKLPVENSSKNLDEHGTRIVLLNLNQGVPASATISKIKSHLASIYREYLKSGDVVINVAGTDLEYIAPNFLEAPFWPTNEGPAENVESIEWITRVDFELSESWMAAGEHVKKPSVPPRITGWVGILAKGNTKSAGVALLWKKKVVVGAGNVSQSETYRPSNIFGTGNTYVSQRVYGELDLSEIEVTTFKDGFIWLAGQQEEMEEKLKEAISSSEMPLLQMAKNYRQTERSKPISAQVKGEVESTVSDLGNDLVSTAEEGSDPFGVEPKPEKPEPTGGEESTRESATFKLPENLGKEFTFEVKDQPGDNSWLRVKPADSGGSWIITLNRAHPFMNSFVHLPGADLSAVFRIAAALGIAEIRGTNAGIEKPSFIRNAINELLRGELSRVSKEED